MCESEDKLNSADSNEEEEEEEYFAADESIFAKAGNYGWKK